MCKHHYTINFCIFVVENISLKIDQQFAIFPSQVIVIYLLQLHKSLHPSLTYGSRHEQTNITDKSHQYLSPDDIWRSEIHAKHGLIIWRQRGECIAKEEGPVLRWRVYTKGGSTQKASSANLPSLPSARRFLIVMEPRERSNHGLPSIGRSPCEI